MSDTAFEERNARGEWRPPDPITLPPLHRRPRNAKAILNWFFGFPGFLWPQNVFWLAVSVVTWLFLTPDLSAMATFEFWWVGIILVRNLGLTLALFGGMHLYLYILRGQGTHLKYTDKPLATGTRRFLFQDQVRDNMFRSLVFAVPIFTGFEVLTYWMFANGALGLFEIASPFWSWVWFGVMLLLTPVIHAFHFYWGHRLLHERWLYKHVHALHHRNVEVGPWSGLAMHPVEHVIYFSTVVVQWLMCLHPLNALFQIQIAVFYAAMAHTGFEKIMFGKRLPIDNNSYFHYLHHKYFECNYGGGLVPFDWIFNTVHDGTETARIAMRQRTRERHRSL